MADNVQSVTIAGETKAFIIRLSAPACAARTSQTFLGRIEVIKAYLSEKSNAET
jgi:hypothetical protein